LSVYALAEDPNPQNHRTKKKKNQQAPVPARFAQPAKREAVRLLKLYCQIESCLRTPPCWLLCSAAALLATLSLSARPEISDLDD
jgi:hypothetical protein